MKTIIIGAVAAGLSTAAKLRRLDQDAVITVYEKGHDISYGACGMPYFLGGIIKQESDLIQRTVEDFRDQHIDIHLLHEVITVVPESKTISIYKHDTNEIIEDTYDKLVIATGANAKRSYVSGSNIDGIHVLKHLEDARKIKQELSTVSKVAIIGGGYIGTEIAENIVALGKEVVLIENNDQILDFLDYDLAKQVELELESLGVHVNVRERLESYRQEDDQILVHTNMSTYNVDMVIEAIGISPNTAFLKELNFDMLPNGAIKVNEYLETSIKDIYAAGDCAAYINDLLHEYTYVPLATHAVKAGKIIAENITGNNTLFKGIIGSTIIKVGSLSISKTGITYGEAQKRKLDYSYVDVHTKTKPNYYPNGKDIMVRIVYENHTNILKGAQIISEKDTNSDINIMSLAISTNMTANAFSQLDFAYSPPYSSVSNYLQIATKKIK